MRSRTPSNLRHTSCIGRTHGDVDQGVLKRRGPEFQVMAPTPVDLLGRDTELTVIRSEEEKVACPVSRTISLLDNRGGRETQCRSVLRVRPSRRWPSSLCVI